MSDANTTIRGPEAPLPERFADAYAELQAIAAALKPAPNRVPDVDAIEPLVRPVALRRHHSVGSPAAMANALARHCQARIDAVRGLVEEQRQTG